MSQRVLVTLEDDLDGSEAAETLTFALDGRAYELDLSEAHAAALREALAPYVANSRRAGRGPGRVSPIKAPSTAPKQRSGATPGDVRVWAKNKGYEVSPRGRVPADVWQAYEADSAPANGKAKASAKGQR